MCVCVCVCVCGCLRGHVCGLSAFVCLFVYHVRSCVPECVCVCRYDTMTLSTLTITQRHGAVCVGSGRASQVCRVE